MDTYRLTNVPESYSCEQVKALLSEDDQKLIVGPISLATSVYAVDPPTKVATITFRQLPSFRENAKQTRRSEEELKTKQPKRIEFEGKLMSQSRPEDSEAPSICIDNILDGLTPLHQPSSEDDVSTVDVVAATGLAGKAFGSWQHPNGTMWLRDLLGSHIKGIRVLIWGRTTKLDGSRSHIAIQDLRDAFIEDLQHLGRSSTKQSRPFVLVGHSLGGIVIKAAYCKAAMSVDLKPLYESIQGLVFFGTPHEGMETNHWEAIWGKEPPRNIIQDLTPGSTLLKDLRESFARIRSDLDVISCFERVETPTVKLTDEGKAERSGPPALYVAESSSILNLVNEVRVPINADHSMIAKLSGAEGSPIHTIERHLDQIVARARITVKSRFQRHCSIHVIATVHSTLGHLLTDLTNIDMLILVEMHELSNVLQTIRDNDQIVSDGPLGDWLAQKLAESIDMMKSLFHGTILALANTDAHFRSEILRSQTHEKSWPTGYAPNQGSLHLTKEHTHELAKEAIPIILDLVDTLKPTILSNDLGVLDRFVTSSVADHLGLDFVSERQNGLQTPPETLLDPLRGSYTESSMPIDGFRLGRYNSGDGATIKDVLIEYRQFGDEISTVSGQQRISKLRTIVCEFVTHLRIITSKPTQPVTVRGHLRPSLKVFEFFGWFVEEKNSRFVFIYNIPQAYRSCLHAITGNIRDLVGWIEATRNPEERPDFGEQFFIAYQISQTIYNLHICGIVHKNINPSNIIIIPPAPKDGRVAGDTRLPRGSAVYLKGFEFSRKVDAHSDHLPSKDETNNIYRHPNRQGNAVDIAVFQPVHDIYALGAVLLEIGRGKNLNQLLAAASKNNELRSKKKASAWHITQQLKEITQKELPQYVGAKYAECVRRCLSEDFGIAEEAEGTCAAEIAMKQVFAFRRLVVEELKRLAFAFGST